MNPRYVAYAAAHGRTTDEMLAHDRDAFPGGRMAGFMIWLGRAWQAAGWRPERHACLSPSHPHVRHF